MPECSNDRCHDGWVEVTDAYAERTFPLPPPLALDATPEEQADHALRVEMATAKQLAAKGTVYPCRLCRPSQFYKWARGCFGPEHDAASCSDCQSDGTAPLPPHTARRPRRSRSSGDPGPTEPPPEPEEDLGGGNMFGSRRADLA